METLHQPNDIINQRYRIVTPLGQGSMGTTYEAEDLTNYQRVAIKAVSLRQATDWKILELFEREARVLANLNNPNIPNYLDYFQIETPEELRFYLVRELIEGESLATLIEKNWQPTEIEVKDIGIQILKILEYLHSFTPPVIHRDIKPQNIIRRFDGQVYLVDFGAVQDVYRNTLTRGGTFVGTLGYMPLEQFRGQVKPASDLYSLAASLLFLLTGKSPADLPQVRMRIDWRSQVKISADFANWLEKMLEPALEERFSSAKDALNALSLPKFERRNLPVLKPKNPPPEGSGITVEMNGDRVEICLPAPPLEPNRVLDGLLLFLYFLFYFVPFNLMACLMFVPIYLISPIALFLFFLLVVVLNIICLRSVLANKANSKVKQKARFEYIKINRESFSLKSSSGTEIIQAKTAEIEKIESENYVCVIWEGTRKHELNLSIKFEEREWLVAELSHLIKLMQS